MSSSRGLVTKKIREAGIRVLEKHYEEFTNLVKKLFNTRDRFIIETMWELVSRCFLEIEYSTPLSLRITDYALIRAERFFKRRLNYFVNYTYRYEEKKGKLLEYRYFKFYSFEAFYRTFSIYNGALDYIEDHISNCEVGFIEEISEYNKDRYSGDYVIRALNKKNKFNSIAKFLRDKASKGSFKDLILVYTYLYEYHFKLKEITNEPDIYAKSEHMKKIHEILNSRQDLKDEYLEFKEQCDNKMYVCFEEYVKSLIYEN